MDPLTHPGPSDNEWKAIPLTLAALGQDPLKTLACLLCRYVDTHNNQLQQIQDNQINIETCSVEDKQAVYNPLTLFTPRTCYIETLGNRQLFLSFNAENFIVNHNTRNILLNLPGRWMMLNCPFPLGQVKGRTTLSQGIETSVQTITLSWRFTGALEGLPDHFHLEFYFFILLFILCIYLLLCLSTLQAFLLEMEDIK